MASLELKETLVPKEKEVSSGFPGPEEKMVQRGQRVVLDLLVSSDLLD